MLDTVGSINTYWRKLLKGQLNQKSVIEAVQTSLYLLENASVRASRERRKNTLQSMNTRLLDMAEDYVIFRSAPPHLFGDGFFKRGKERGGTEVSQHGNYEEHFRAIPRNSFFFKAHTNSSLMREIKTSERLEVDTKGNTPTSNQTFSGEGDRSPKRLRTPCSNYNPTFCNLHGSTNIIVQILCIPLSSTPSP